MERDREYEKLNRCIKRLKKVNNEQAVDILFFKLDAKERKEKRAAKYRNRHATDVSAPFYLLTKDLYITDSPLGVKILKRIAKSSIIHAATLSNEPELRCTTRTNGTYVIAEVYGNSIDSGFGVAKRCTSDADDVAVGIAIALRAATLDYLGKRV